MKNYQIFLFICLIAMTVIPTKVTAQKHIGAIHDTVRQPAAAGLATHYRLIQHAETQYIRGNIQRSAELYLEAYQSFRGVDPRIFSFCVFNVLPKVQLDSAIVVGFCEVFNRHLPLSYKDSLEFWTDYYLDTLLKITFQIDRQSLNNHLRTLEFGANPPIPGLGETLDSMLAIDQSFRRQPYNPDMADQVRLADSIHQKLLIELIKSNSVFSEETTGFRLSNIRTLLDHFTDRGYVEWYPYIKQQVMLGNIHNQILADAVDNYMVAYHQIHGIRDNDYFGTRRVWGLFDQLVVIMPTRKELKKINARRDEIMLEPFSAMVEKLVFQFRNNNTPTFYPMITMMESKVHNLKQYSADEIIELQRQQELNIKELKEIYGKRRVKVYTMENH